MTAAVAVFLLLVFVLSVPFYLLGTVGGRLPGMSTLPLSALMTFMPMLAALILVYRQRGVDGARALLKRTLHFRRVIGVDWVLVTLLFMPAVCVLEFFVLRFTGSAVPFPHIAPGETLFFFFAFFIGAICEELGWQGYAYPALRIRHNALGASVVLGLVWALWHVIPFVQLGRSFHWIHWHCLSTIALRIIVVWLYENTRKSVFIAVLFHTMINLSLALFPNAGSYYDPFVTFVILALAAGLIVFLWRPTTLAYFRYGSEAKHDDVRPLDASPE